MNWISVNKKIPNEYDWVLVTDGPKENKDEPVCIDIRRWNGTEWESCNENNDSPTFSDIIYTMDKVSYWMELPDKPT